MTTSGAPGVRLLDAIDSPASPSPAVKGSRVKVLWGLTGVALLGGLAAWMVPSGHPSESSASSSRVARAMPNPASTPASAGEQTLVAAASSTPPPAATPAQIVAMTIPHDTAQRPAESAPPAAPGAVDALAAESLAERQPVVPTEAAAVRKAAPKKSTAKPSGKKGAETANSGSGAKTRTKAARQRAEPDPDADVVAAIMASMDRQAAAAAASKPASQAANRRP